MPALTFKPDEPHGTIHGVFTEIPNAHYEQYGHFFDVDGVDLTPGVKVVYPPAKPGTLEAIQAKILERDLEIANLREQLARLTGVAALPAAATAVAPAPQGLDGELNDDDPDAAQIDLKAWRHGLKAYPWGEVQAAVKSAYGKHPRSKEEAYTLIDVNKLHSVAADEDDGA